MPLPSVHYGRPTEKNADWRELDGRYDDTDDDAELPVTPKSVVAMLGFDPLDESDDDEDTGRAADADDPGMAEHDIHGMHIVVETQKGDMRTGPGFEVEMPAHYGYIDGVTGADGDSLDCYLGDGPSNGWVYIIDQRHMGKGKGFDEHKCMINFSSQQEALQAYRDGHHRSVDVLMDWTPMPVNDFKWWMKTGDMSKPCSEQV